MILKKSVIIAGRHFTSISIESEFYDELVLIAKRQNMTINQLVTKIDSARQNENLSSAIRIYILQFIKNESSTNQE